jgi:hypothetical protein
MESLTSPLRRYVDLSKRLTDLNAKARELREERQSVELDLAAVYNERAGSALPQKIALNQSKMVFLVKKPGEWKKGWTLSKKHLEEYLREILPEHGEDVMREIVIRHERKLIATDYAFDVKPFEEEETVT